MTELSMKMYLIVAIKMLSTEGIYMKKATIYFTLWRRVFASNLIILTFIVKHLTPARISLHLNFMTHAHTTHTLKNEYLLGKKKTLKSCGQHIHTGHFSPLQQAMHISSTTCSIHTFIMDQMKTAASIGIPTRKKIWCYWTALGIL